MHCKYDVNLKIFSVSYRSVLWFNFELFQIYLTCCVSWCHGCRLVIELSCLNMFSNQTCSL